jgi:glutathione synthase/RimK-type ligase-like ATP-grasp enzyme
MLKPYITSTLLFDAAVARNLDPHWETKTGLFSVAQGSQRAFVYYTKTFGSSQLGATICQDKYLSRVFLSTHGYAIPDFCVTDIKSEAVQFVDSHCPAIQKPVRGEKSIGVRKVSGSHDIDFHLLSESIFEDFVEGDEWRCLVVGGAVVGQQQKRLSPVPDHPWAKYVTNIDASHWNEKLSVYATTICAQLHMGIIAVDFILPSASSQPVVLEINSMPGIYSFHHPDEGKAVNMADIVLSYALSVI